MIDEVAPDLSPHLWGYPLRVKFEVQVDKQIHRLISRSFVLGLYSDAAQGLQAYQLVVFGDMELLVGLLVKEALVAIDDLEELVEALHLPDRDFLEVDIGRIAENLREEVLSFIFVEEEVLSFIVGPTGLSMLVDPL
jgi:hypothetical protein